MSAAHGPTGRLAAAPGATTERDRHRGQLDAALAYAGRGWRVLPVASRGKVPLLKDWPTLATSDPATIHAWWQQWPFANVGLAMGAGLLALDIDPGHGGRESLAALEAAHGPLPATVTSLTGSGGEHRLFSYDGPSITYSAGTLGPGLDIRADGGQIVAPGSVHPNGRLYRWGANSHPDDVPIAPASGWLVARLRPAVTLPPMTERFDTATALTGVSEGTRDTTLWQLACKLRRADVPQATAERLVVEAAAKCTPPETATTARDKVQRAYAKYRPAPASDPPDPTQHEGETSSTSHMSHWPTLHTDALYGLAGRFVRAVGPHTEADPAALLVGFLLAFGNAAGRASGADVGSTRHHLNEFALVVGSTSRGRKDTARDEVLSFFQRVDPTWTGTRVLSGLSSGEGLIAAVRDPSNDEDQDAPKDKRLLVTESEFTSVLKVASREGNIVSEILRQAWDGRALRTLTRTNPLHATAPHVSILASVTMDGLQRHLTASDAANGFANRFLFVATKRSRLLAQGGSPAAIGSAVSPLVQSVHRALDWIRQPRTFTRDTAAAALWERVYGFLDEYQADGLVGALTARPEAHLLRLSCLYAALDCSEIIIVAHLRAAIAIWRYCERSVEIIFQRATGDSVSDRLLSALTSTPSGLTKTALHRRLGNNASADELNAALVALEESGRVTSEIVATNSKPARRYRLAAASPSEHEPDPWDALLGYEEYELTNNFLRVP